MIQPRPRGIHLITVIVLLVGVLASSGLAASAYVVHQRNEAHLLRQRVYAAADSFTKVVPSLQSGLASAAKLMEATDANPASFQLLFGSLTGAKGPFSSASVWDLSAKETKPLVTLGPTPRLAGQSRSTIRSTLRVAARQPMAVVPFMTGSDPRVGYAVAASKPGHTYVVYAETPLPSNRWMVNQRTIAFDDLSYAAYLGPAEDTTDVLAASTHNLPLKGERATAMVPYGNTSILLVVSPQHDLGGRLLQILPWLILAVGTLISIGFAALAERLLRRQDHAEALAVENARLYSDQRTLAQSLQESFLPEALPDVAGVDFAARYEPGVDGIEIGGDWYDVWSVDEDHVVIVVGDVSGRGLRAATIVGSLRYAIRAYAAQGDGPAEILSKLNMLLSIEHDEHFATVICAEIDLVHRTLTLASAGHPSPLLIDADGCRFIPATTGPPIGVLDESDYTPQTIEIPTSATVVAFTDGLFERRGESITVGLERLRLAASRFDLPLEELLSHTFTELVGTGSADDIALLGVHWQT